ncbi:hypothetical protein EYF80_058732 [Liparis tanakae]|uniref:Uncharacterized protein n=1 Tax=Liparis tanakae TaxID=230148 RepID=A0A4Z2EQ97_9TELE|nr:hypothetical protein EYF80_058732 [Liparis tanakae]
MLTSNDVEQSGVEDGRTDQPQKDKAAGSRTDKPVGVTSPQHRTTLWASDCLLSMILRMVSLSAWWTNGVAVAFMYCSIRVLASVVARNNVVASSGSRAPAEEVKVTSRDPQEEAGQQGAVLTTHVGQSVDDVELLLQDHLQKDNAGDDINVIVSE